MARRVGWRGRAGGSAGLRLVRVVAGVARVAGRSAGLRLVRAVAGVVRAAGRSGLRASLTRSLARAPGPSALRLVSFAAPWLVQTHDGAWPQVSPFASGDCGS
jgi:hypothetical protein